MATSGFKLPGGLVTGILHVTATTGAVAGGLVVNADITNATIDLTTKVTSILPNANTTAASANTASAIVARDASGNFAAATITASLTGLASLNLPLAGGTLAGNLLFTDATYDIGASGATRPRDIFTSRDVTVGRNLSVGATIIQPSTHTTGLFIGGLKSAFGGFGPLLGLTDPLNNAVEALYATFQIPNGYTAGFAEHGYLYYNTDLATINDLFYTGAQASIDAMGNITDQSYYIESTPDYVAEMAFRHSLVTVRSTSEFAWNSTDNAGLFTVPTPDLGFSRNAAGVVEVNNGTPGTFRDIKVRTADVVGLTFNGHTCSLVANVVTCP